MCKGAELRESTCYVLERSKATVSHGCSLPSVPQPTPIYSTLPIHQSEYLTPFSHRNWHFSLRTINKHIGIQNNSSYCFPVPLDLQPGAPGHHLQCAVKEQNGLWPPASLTVTLSPTVTMRPHPCWGWYCDLYQGNEFSSNSNLIMNMVLNNLVHSSYLRLA